MRGSSPRNVARLRLSSGTPASAGAISAASDASPLAASKSRTVLRYCCVDSLVSGVTPGSAVGWQLPNDALPPLPPPVTGPPPPPAPALEPDGPTLPVQEPHQRVPAAASAATTDTDRSRDKARRARLRSCIRRDLSRATPSHGSRFGLTPRKAAGEGWVRIHKIPRKAAGGGWVRIQNRATLRRWERLPHVVPRCGRASSRRRCRCSWRLAIPRRSRPWDRRVASIAPARDVR